jgi:hypothetical protein
MSISPFQTGGAVWLVSVVRLVSTFRMVCVVGMLCVNVASETCVFVSYHVFEEELMDSYLGIEVEPGILILISSGCENSSSSQW